MSEINLSSNIKGAIDDMLQGSIAGNISLIGGGSAAVIEPKSITANGTYEAPEGVDGYNPITVNVPSEEPTIENIYINYNGTFEASTYGWDGFGKVEVEVIPSVIPITITENGTYIPENADGYNPVVVNVPAIDNRIDGIFYKPIAENNMLYKVGFYGDVSTEWTGGTNIGCTLNGQTDVSNYSKIIISVDISDSYEYHYHTNLERLRFIVGVTDNIWNSLIYVGYNTGDHIKAAYEYDLNDSQVVSLMKVELDISDVNDMSLYPFVSLLGISCTNLKIEFE